MLVLNGDSYINFSVNGLLDFHISQKADATILLSSATHGREYGNVELAENKQILTFQEKPEDSRSQLINAGVYCPQKELVELQSAGSTSLEEEWFPLWVSNKDVYGMVLSESFYDIGTSERFELAQHKIK